MSELHSRLGQLSPEKRATLRALLEKKQTSQPNGRPLDFSLLFFSSDGSGSSDNKYGMLIESAKIADRNGFSAVWTPERHFQSFGGLYPNPAVLGAALAMVTERLQIRAGSVVLPLHDLVRVAEEWAVVDNLSGGRVALSFASGWHKGDFAFRPEAFASRRDTLEASINTVKRLWAGETLPLAGVDGVPTEIQTYPRPVQPDFAFWLTGASEETWRKAGRLGANVLCLMGPSIKDLRDKIVLYRTERAAAGHDPATGKISVTLHTFVGEDNEQVRALVRPSLTAYLEDYVQQFRALMPSDEIAKLELSKDAILDFAFERYFSASSLLGDANKCIGMLNRLTEIGVDEIACLVDFGLPAKTVIDGLKRLVALRHQFLGTRGPDQTPPSPHRPAMTPNQLANLSPAKQALLMQKLGSLKAPAKEVLPAMRERVAEHLEVDRRPLLSLYASGEIGPVDAVAVGCLSNRLLDSDPARETYRFTHQLCHDLPVFANVRTLATGRIASLILPRFYSQIYLDQSEVVKLVQQCRELAKFLGARTVSLTGLIPSATDYGRAIPSDTSLPAVTTGHATTTSAVVLSVRQLLRLAQRDLRNETLAFIGLGSIGSSTLRLLLSVLPHPRRLLLCDVYQKRAFVEELMREVREELGFTGELSFHHQDRGVADQAYEASFIVGATNVPNVLDVARLRPGTLIVDDSDPHCFDSQAAIARLERDGDILFSEGGALAAPQPLQHLAYVPTEFAAQLPVDTDPRGDRKITGCVLSSLLSATQGYPTTIGEVALADARIHYARLVEEGYDAAYPHCSSYTVPKHCIDNFAARFSTRAEATSDTMDA